MLRSTAMKAFSVCQISLKQNIPVAAAAACKTNSFVPNQRFFHNSPICLVESTDDAVEENARSPSEKTINQVTLLGRVGNDPVRRGSAEHPVVMFSLATHSNYAYSSGEVVKKTDWHRVSIFKPSLRELACNYVTKGQRILIQGRIIYGEIKDSDGQSRQTCTIVADDIVCFKKNE